MVEWLLSPVSGAAEHALDPVVSWHARGMLLAWGILVPLGILVARYFKVTPRQDWPAVLDNRFWWDWHRRLQYAALAIAVAALGLAIWSSWPHDGLLNLHASLGWVVLAIGAVQLGSALLRGSKGGPTGKGATNGDLSGDHYDMTPRRVVFEVVHKFGGLIAALASVAVIVLGLLAVDAPRWMFLTMALWWGLMVAAAAVLQARGRAIDTYQAIWGPDPSLPGNRRRPIGIAVRQMQPSTTEDRAAD